MAASEHVTAFIPPLILTKPERIAPSYAWLGHIPFAFFLVHACQPERLVELGTYTGNSYFAFCQAVKTLAIPTRCFAIDTWKGDKHGGLYGEEVFKDVNHYNEAHYAHFSTLVRSTFDAARDRFDDGSIDILHIDGLHTYEAAKHDFESWRPKLSDRAVVLFHDVCEKREDFGVWKLWAELEDRYLSVLFQHSHGLGVLAAGENIPPLLKHLMTLDKHQAALVLKLYEKIGSCIYLAEQSEVQQHEIAQLKTLIKDQDAAIKDQDAAIKAIQQSLSWKITRPLRFARNQGLKILSRMRKD